MGGLQFSAHRLLMANGNFPNDSKRNPKITESKTTASFKSID